MAPSRRNFIRTASLFAAASVIPGENKIFSATGVSANDRINVAMIGGYGMGWNDLVSFLKTLKLNVLHYVMLTEMS